MKPKQPPRASIAITILNDEDYRLLVTSRGGVEAFGVFVAVVIVGRQRLQDGKAHQIEGTDALRFENSLPHVAVMAHLTVRQIESCVGMLARTASETGSEPWLYLDDTQHLVVRNFFKFNTSTAWGGIRDGAGRPPKGNQVDFKSGELESQDSNQDESSPPVLVPRARTGSGSGSGSGANPPFSAPLGGDKKRSRITPIPDGIGLRAIGETNEPA